eukprot:747849-Hanusia_phi.AAC.2
MAREEERRVHHLATQRFVPLDAHVAIELVANNRGHEEENEEDEGDGQDDGNGPPHHIDHRDHPLQHADQAEALEEAEEASDADEAEVAEEGEVEGGGEALLEVDGSANEEEGDKDEVEAVPRAPQVELGMPRKQPGDGLYAEGEAEEEVGSEGDFSLGPSCLVAVDGHEDDVDHDKRGDEDFHLQPAQQVEQALPPRIAQHRADLPLRNGGSLGLGGDGPGSSKVDACIGVHEHCSRAGDVNRHEREKGRGGAEQSRKDWAAAGRDGRPAV